MFKIKPLLNFIMSADRSLDFADRSEEEMGEIVKAWLRRYLPAIILGIVIALGIIGFLDWRKVHQRNIDLQFAYQLEQLQAAVSSNQPDEAKKAYTAELKNNDSAAGDLAALLMAGVYTQIGEIDAAQEALHKASGAKDELVAQRAKLELASLQASGQQYDAALQALQGLEKSAYAPAAYSLQGDIYYLQGKNQNALAAYQEAQKIAPSALLQLRIQQLQTAVNITQ